MRKLLFHDLQQLHGACLHADTAGNAFRGGILRLHDHNLHGAGLNALAAGNTQFLIDHVNAGLGVLGDGFMLAYAHALAALDAGVGLCAGTLCNDLDAGQIRIKFLVESGGASLDALQASHTFSILIDNELLHNEILLLS